MDDPSDAIYSIVEQAYLRFQAGDILSRCVEEGNPEPIRQLVEGLVLDGPNNISALREILGEANQRRSQMRDDLRQMLVGLEKNLGSYGLHMKGKLNARTISKLSANRFLSVLREQDISDETTQAACMQLLRDSRSLIRKLESHLRLMDEIEDYVQDWLWGLAYQSTHIISSEPQSEPQHWVL
jgi:hypothetical protein